MMGFKRIWSSVFGSRGFGFGFGYKNTLFNATTSFFDYGLDTEKINVMFSSPALLKAVSLYCEVFSLGEIYVYDGEKQIEKDPLIDMLENPNPMQTKQQFLWDYAFWQIFGTSNLYIDSAEPTKANNKLYFLDCSKLRYSDYFVQKKDFIFLSDTEIKNLNSQTVKYQYENGGEFSFRFDKLIVFSDLTNGVGNWFKSPSKIDALYKVISNSEAVLDADNINIRYSGKFIVSGKQDPENVTELPLSPTEKQDIETKIDGHKTVHAMKSMVDIKRFVSDSANLKLDDSYLNKYYVIGSMLGLPKEVLEASAKGSTYENQEKAMGKLISYTMQPKADALMNGLNKKFGYTTGKKLVMSYDHCSFMQVFEKERSETKKVKAEAMTILQKAGVSQEDINKYLDLDFKNIKPIDNGNQQ